MSYLTPKVIQRISKEIADLHKTPLDDIEIASDIEDLSQIQAVIHGPSGTPYEGGKFTIKLVFCEEFPSKPPKGFFLTRIFHPNVSREGDICVNTLKRDWKATNTLRHVLLVIRCLMIEPNPDSALNADAGRLLQENYSVFEEKARMFTEIHAKQSSSPSVTQLTTPTSTTTLTSDKQIATHKSLSAVDFESDPASKENVNSLNNASAAPKKLSTGLKSSSLLVKKNPVAKVAAKNDKKKALNRL